MLPKLSMDSLLQNVSWFENKHFETSITEAFHINNILTTGNAELSPNTISPSIVWIIPSHSVQDTSMIKITFVKMVKNYHIAVHMK